MQIHAVFGGSFDPVHFGHIKAALELIEKYPISTIRFVPCKLSPLKDIGHASPQDRMNMLNIIAASNASFITDDRELHRVGPSYSIFTIVELRQELGLQQPLAWIMGVDAFCSFSKWHEWRDYMKYCHILLLPRPGYAIIDATPEAALFAQHHTESMDQLTHTACGFIYLTDVTPREIASTHIRDKLAQGDSQKFVIPGTIWNYIKRNRLYGVHE